MPNRHYYFQCPQIFMFSTCTNTSPHWGNTCPQIATYLAQKKALAVRRRVTKEEYAMAAQQTESRAPKPRLFVAQGNFQKESTYFDIFADTASAKV